MIEKPRTFETFPEKDVCPICGTNGKGECVLLPIDGTGDDGICEAIPVHLWCAVATNYSRNVSVIYRRVPRH